MLDLGGLAGESMSPDRKAILVKAAIGFGALEGLIMVLSLPCVALSSVNGLVRVMHVLCVKCLSVLKVQFLAFWRLWNESEGSFEGRFFVW